MFEDLDALLESLETKKKKETEEELKKEEAKKEADDIKTLKEQNEKLTKIAEKQKEYLDRILLTMSTNAEVTAENRQKLLDEQEKKRKIEEEDSDFFN